MRTPPGHAVFLITSDPTMTQPTEDLPLASEAEHFALDFPYQKSVKVRRDLKHFELWLRDVYKSTIDGPIPLAYIYKDFFLSHITLYPSAMMPGRLLPADLERELLRSGVLDGGELSCQQVASMVLSVLRWQHHRYKKIDIHKLMHELIPFYRQLRKMTRNQELTYKSALESKRVLNVFRRHLATGPQSARDLVIILLTWGFGCSPSELTRLSFDDLEINRRSLQWGCLCSGTPLKLDQLTALSIYILLCENLDLMGHFHLLLNRQDDSTWRALSEGEVEVILEHHYRYAGALYGFEHYSVPTGLPTPDLLPQEEAAFTKMLKMYTKNIFAANRRTEEEHEHDDWDAAVRKISLQCTSIEGKTVTADEQIDWDEIIKP